MRFLSISFGILLTLGMLSSAQEPSVPENPRPARARRAFRLQPASNPDPTPAPAAPSVPPQQFQPAQSQPMAAATPVPTPALPEQLPPPTPPEVTFHNGQLTVQAMNSTLGALLAAIRNKTGIQFEGLEGSANDRVVVSIGPAPEGEVLAAILGGSRFDYLVLDRPDSPGIVQRVILSPHGGAPNLSAGAPAGSLAANQAEGEDDDVPDETASGAEPDSPQDTPARPPLIQAQQQPQPNSPTKTPEQLFEEIRRMQQQQPAQNQAPPNPNQAPVRPPPVPQ